MFGITVVVIYSLFGLISSMDIIETINYGRMICCIRIKDAVSIIRPVYGADEFTLNNFISWENQRSDRSIEVIYSMQMSDDPSISHAKALEGRIIVNSTKPGYSGKTSNLHYGIEASHENIVVFVDSDCYAENDTLIKMYRQLQSGYDIVAAIPIHNESKNIWAKLYSLFWNFNQIGLYLNSLIHRDSGNLIGVCVMTRKSVLKDLGGISAFKDYIAEDLILGKEAVKKGYKIGLGPLVYSPVGKMRFRDLIDKFSRAALASSALNAKDLLKAVVPVSYLVGILLIMVFKDSGWLIHISLLLVMRVAYSSLSMYEIEKKVKIHVEVILMDLLFICVYALSVFTRTVRWGNISYKVDKAGKIIRSTQVDLDRRAK